MADAIWNQRNKLKSVFQRILFPLAKTVDALRPKKDDSSNEMSKKIMALSNLENTNDDEILAICEPFIDIRDECFISVMSFLSKSMKEKCYRLVKKLFEKDDYSWVQRIAILNLIDNLDQFKMEAYMNDYNHKCIDFLVKCSLSLQTELANQSRQVISRFVSLNNVEIFRDSILKCDFFNLQITKNILQLLNVIVNSISPSPMRCFIGIVLELFDFTLSDIVNADSDDLAFESINIYPSFVADCFEFLSHYPGLFPYRKSIERICICKMQEVYYSFTQEKLFSQAQLDNTAQSTTSSSKKNASASQMTKILKNSVRPILSTITTDVVADASLVRYEFLEPLKNCLQYLAANQVQTTIYRPTFLKLLPIFPKEILPYFYDHSMIIANCNENNTESFLSANEIEMIKPKILRIFSSNRHQVVIARCCEFFYQSKIITQGILIQVKKIFETTRIKSSNSAFEFFKLIYTVEPESAITYLKKLLNIPVDNNTFEIIPLKDLTKNELALLASNIPSVHKILSEMEEFSFLQYKTNRFAAKAWFEHNDYTTWPLIEPDLLEDIKKMFNKTYSVHIKDCSLIDKHHWKFLMKNKSLFFKETIKSYSDSNRSSLKAICVFNTNPLEKKRNHFNFSESIQKDIIDNLDESAKLLPSTSLLIKKGRFVNNEILVKNFLMFSNIQASPYLLNEMKEAFPNLSSNFNEYEGRFAKKTKNKNPIFVNKEFVKKVESHNKEEKKSLGLQIIAAQDEPIIIEEEEDQENKDDEKVWADEENKDEIKLEQEEETTEDSREDQKEENIEEAKEEKNDEIKEKNEKEDQKEENKEEENKVENKEEGKEENIEKAKEENEKEENKEDGKEENKDETKVENEKEENKEETKEEQKEDNKEEDKGENKEEQKEENNENKEEQKEENNENKEEQKEDNKEEDKGENKEEQKEENNENKEENKEEQKEENKEEQKEENNENEEENNENEEENKEKQKEENKEEQKEEIKLEFSGDNTEESEDTIKLHQEQQPKLPPFPIRNEKDNTNPKPVPVPVDPSILSFDPNFPIKSKFIKSLCLLPPKNTVLISMYRMHLINRINEIRSPKQFFYFLRFLRINLVIFKNSREALAIRQNTIENYFPIINKLRILASGKKSSNDQDFDYFKDEKDLSFVLLEFAKLSSKLYTIQELARIHKNVLIPGKTDSIDLLLVSNLVIHSSKFRNMAHSVFSLSNGILNSYSIHQLKSSNLSRIPSFLSFIITTIKMLPNEESSMFFTRHFKTMFEDDIVADMAIDYLSFYLQKASIIAGEK
ncbi:hypothetical protein M9Y10_018109, partial [Tritrichomonas musculus]